MIKITPKFYFFLFIIFLNFSGESYAKRAAIIIDYETNESVFEVNADTLKGKNTIQSVAARSINPKLNTTIKILAYN